MPLIFFFPRWQLPLHFMTSDDNTGQDRGRFAEFILALLLIVLIFHMSNCKPTFAPSCTTLLAALNKNILVEEQNRVNSVKGLM